MSYQEERLQEIADAIREVKGTTEKIPATNFASEIVGLSVVKPSGIKTITENGDYDVSNYAWASVNVEADLNERVIIGRWTDGFFVYEFKENGILLLNGFDGTYTILGNTIQVSSTDDGVTLTFVLTYNRDADTLVGVGDDGIEFVVTRVPTTLTTKEITENGTYKASDDGADGYSEVVVNVASSGEEEIDFDRVFGNNTPEQIQKVGNQIAVKGLTSAEVAETYGWKIGDTTNITLTTGEAIQMRIIGFNHDTASVGGTAGITLDMVNCLNTKYPMNSTNTNSGGWEASKLRTQTLPSIKATLPTEWQTIITKVDKYCWDNNVTKTLSEDLFLMSAIEKRGNGIATEGTRYEYYVNTPYTQTVKYVGTSVSVWWLRTPQGDSDFAIVLSDGSGASVGASYSQGLSFAFCVGSKPVPVIAGLPIEVTTDTDMTNALVEDNLGKVYKFTGTSETYETDAIYIVSEVE